MKTLRQELRELRAEGLLRKQAREEWAPEAYDSIKLDAREAALRGEPHGVFNISCPAATNEARLLVREELKKLLEDEDLQNILFVGEPLDRVSFTWE